MSHDIDMYAPPQSVGWSGWQTVYEITFEGPKSLSISCTPAGNTQIYGQVRYWNTECNQVVETFIEDTSITAGKCIATVEIRLQGNPFGSQVRVTVD